MNRGTADRLRVLVYLPDIKGHYKPVMVPFYVMDILERVRPMYNYTYKLVGVNPQRPMYGIRDDLHALEAWAKRYYADFTIIRINTERNNYYGVFEMTDPVALQLEKAGFLKGGR